MAKATKTSKKATKKTAKSSKATKTSKASAKSSKATEKAVKAKTNGKDSKKSKVNNPQIGITRLIDIAWNTKKLSVFKALKSLKAVGSGNARDTNTIAAKAKCTPKNVRHYCYHALVSKIIGLAQLEGTKSYSFYLTKKGQKLDLAAIEKGLTK